MTIVCTVFLCVSYFSQTCNVYLLTAIYDVEITPGTCELIMAHVLHV